MVQAGRQIQASDINDLERRVSVVENLSVVPPLELIDSYSSKCIRMTGLKDVSFVNYTGTGKGNLLEYSATSTAWIQTDTVNLFDANGVTLIASQIYLAEYVGNDSGGVETYATVSFPSVEVIGGSEGSGSVSNVTEIEVDYATVTNPSGHIAKVTPHDASHTQHGVINLYSLIQYLGAGEKQADTFSSQLFVCYDSTNSTVDSYGITNASGVFEITYGTFAYGVGTVPQFWINPTVANSVGDGQPGGAMGLTASGYEYDQTAVINAESLFWGTAPFTVDYTTHTCGSIAAFGYAVGSGVPVAGFGVSVNGAANPNSNSIPCVCPNATILPLTNAIPTYNSGTGFPYNGSSRSGYSWNSVLSLDTPDSATYQGNGWNAMAFGMRRQDMNLIPGGSGGLDYVGTDYMGGASGVVPTGALVKIVAGGIVCETTPLPLRAGEVGPLTGASTQTVTFSSTLGTSNYSIQLSTTQAGLTLSCLNKVATGFQIAVPSSASGAYIDWSVQLWQ